MERYVCPPWYECRCVSGQPVSKSTMLNHRRAANKKIREIGRGPFKWGPRVADGSIELITFECLDNLEENISDDEGYPESPRKLSKNLTRFERIAHNSCTASGFSNRDVVMESPSRIARREHDIPSPLTLHQNQLNARDPSVLGVGVHSEAVPPTSNSTTDPDIQLQHKIRSGHEAQSSSSDQEDVGYGNIDITESDGDNFGSEASYEEPIENQSLEHPDLLTIYEHPELPDTLDIRNASFSRIPDLLPWIFENQSWVQLFHKHALPEAFLDEACERPKAPCKQWKTITNNISQASGLQGELESYLICRDHMAFVPLNETESITSCSECGASCPLSPSLEETYHYFPVIPRLRAMVADARTSEQLYSYRRSFVAHDSLLSDYFDGKEYKDLCNLYGGESATRDDIFLLASTDGFSPYKNRNYDLWSLAALNFNLPPDKRYAPQNVLPLSFIPGPSQPKNLQSFLRPFVLEMKRGAKGIKMKFYDETERLVRIHLIGFTGDQPAVSKVSGLVGPNGKSPCRDCRIHVYYSNHYHFPSKLLEGTSLKLRKHYNPRRLPLRSTPENQQTILSLHETVGSQLRELRKNSGIREDSVLFQIPNLKPYRSFPHDVMHTFYNMQNEVLRIILGPYQDDFSINKQQVLCLDEELAKWKWGIPSQLGPKPKALSSIKSGKLPNTSFFRSLTA